MYRIILNWVAFAPENKLGRCFVLEFVLKVISSKSPSFILLSDLMAGCCSEFPCEFSYLL